MEYNFRCYKFQGLKFDFQSCYGTVELYYRNQLHY